MKLSELIAAVGDENVTFQVLLNDAATVDKTKHGTKIAFLTDQVQAEELLLGGTTKKLGIVVWFPRDKAGTAIRNHKLTTSTTSE